MPHPKYKYSITEPVPYESDPLPYSMSQTYSPPQSDSIAIIFRRVTLSPITRRSSLALITVLRSSTGVLSPVCLIAHRSYHDERGGRVGGCCAPWLRCALLHCLRASHIVRQPCIPLPVPVATTVVLSVGHDFFF